MNLQLFALNYTKVDNPYGFTITKNIYVKGTNDEEAPSGYDLTNYYTKISNYSTITSLPTENANYIVEALPHVYSCYNMLLGCSSLRNIYFFNWDTSKITNVESMFANCKSLGRYIFMNLLDFSNVTNMRNTFSECSSIKIIYTPTFTSKVTDVYGLFNGCSTLYRVNLSDSDTSGVSNFGYMFYNCKTLSNINGTIDMKSCTDYTNMFYGCGKLRNVKIKNPPSGFNGGGLSSSQYTIVS